MIFPNIMRPFRLPTSDAFQPCGILLHGTGVILNHSIPVVIKGLSRLREQRKVQLLAQCERRASHIKTFVQGKLEADEPSVI